MMRLPNLTSRNALIAAHDALATAAALLGSFYLRFEGNFADRLRLLLNISWRPRLVSELITFPRAGPCVSGAGGEALEQNWISLQIVSAD
jgi:hypothetical protein